MLEGRAGLILLVVKMEMGIEMAKTKTKTTDALQALQPVGEALGMCRETATSC
jgi:hypothetical protein